jgi:hypothetical protein
MSMLFDTLLADLSKAISHTKAKVGEGDPNLPFAGMHVILFGDFHQFPLISNYKGALYSREPTQSLKAAFG